MSALLNLSESDWLCIEREACKRSLAEFVKSAWHIVEPSQHYIHGWHIDAVCAHLEAVTRCEINRLLINIPPGTMKSLLCGVFWPAWEWGPAGLPNMRYVSASHSKDFATRDTLKMRRLVSSEWYQTRWAVPLTKDQNAKVKFENKKTGFRQAMAMSSMTGSRGDRVLLDDPHSVEGAISNAERIRTLREFTETVPSRLNNPDSSAIIVIMQRLHEEDISGYILSDDYGYTHLCLPMEYEPERSSKSTIYPDPRKTDGELLFPARFSRVVVDRDKKMMGSHAVAGQFQQRPAPRGGLVLRGSWFGRWVELPAMKEMIIFGDTANKTKTANDYSVFQCWLHGMDGRIYLVDQIRGKWEANELKNRLRAFWSKWQEHGCRKVIVEDAASGTGLIQEIKREFKIPIFGITHSKDKYTRVMDAAPQIEVGNVLIPDDAPWVSDFIDECELFTPNDSHPHDDQIDPMCDAIKQFLQTKKARGFFTP